MPLDPCPCLIRVHPWQEDFFYARSKLIGNAFNPRNPELLRQVSGPGRSSKPCQTAQDCFKSNLTLHPGQRRAETKVTRPAKSHMLVVRSIEDELIGIRESFGITIGCGHDCHDGLSLADLFISDLHVVRAIRPVC